MYKGGSEYNLIFLFYKQTRMWKIAGKKFWAMAKAKITCLTSERSEWGVVIFAAIAKEFPAIFHRRAIFLCQAFFSSLKRKRMLLLDSF